MAKNPKLIYNRIYMKKFYLLVALAICSGISYSQTLISYGNSTISREDFLRAYNKNKPVTPDKEKAMREYLELYSNFKLKVKAAQELRIDTLQQISYDVANFRNQILENYLSDEKGVQRLESEAFQRSLADLHVLHFFIPAGAGITSEDSLKAISGINEIFSKLNAGNTSYPSIVQEVSSKYLPARFSDIGFITAFTLPYEFENVIYNTPVGKQSNPYKSKNGWHIFKVSEQRKSAGKWKVAQVLFTFPPDASPEVKAAIAKKADSVYSLIKGGMHFGTAVKNFSDDKLSYMADGELPEFGTGKFSYQFEKEVFALKNDGDITRPFATSFGYHIVRRISHTDAITDPNDDAVKYELRQRVMADPRINLEKQKFAKAIVEQTKFKRNLQVKDAELYKYADSMLKDPSLEKAMKLPISKKTIANFPKAPVTGEEWLLFIRDYRYNPEQYKGESPAQLWDKFVSAASVDYYKKHLEDYNPDFKFQMQEFKEGNMLFEIMERNVWNKAITDTAGLLTLYNSNKTKYKWGKSADVLIFNNSTEQVANKLMAELKAGKDWKTLAEESNATIQADSGRYEILQIMGSDYKGEPQANTYSPITVGPDGSAAFVKFLRIYEPDQQRSFEEARGLVINDYQNLLEQQWLASLRKKYPVKVNEAVFKTLVQ